MVLDESAVLNIILTHFQRKVELEAAVSVMSLESYEMEDDFAYSVDYADLEDVDDYKVRNIEGTSAEDGEEVSGILGLNAEIIGFVHGDGEDREMGTCKKYMEYEFRFEVQDGEPLDFEISCLF